MAGSVAHVLNIDIFDALDLDDQRLAILYNEAKRQRAIDAIVVSWGFNGAQEQIDAWLKAHGDYTDGFYERERERVFDFFKQRSG